MEAFYYNTEVKFAKTAIFKKVFLVEKVFFHLKNQDFDKCIVLSGLSLFVFALYYLICKCDFCR
jgi:hypothetical protein